MSVLAGYANSTLTRLSRAVGRLEKRGWVQRAPDPSDGRSTLAALTTAGVEKLDQASPGHVLMVRRLLGSLTGAQVRQLREISRRLLGALREEEGWQPASDAGHRPG